MRRMKGWEEKLAMFAGVNVAFLFLDMGSCSEYCRGTCKCLINVSLLYGSFMFVKRFVVVMFVVVFCCVACGSSESTPGAEECALIKDREACLAAGCTDFKNAQFGSFDGDVCTLDLEWTSVCVVREKNNGLENNALQGYRRTDADGQKIVMVLDSDVDALKGWSLCRDDSYCGCR